MPEYLRNMFLHEMVEERIKALEEEEKNLRKRVDSAPIGSIRFIIKKGKCAQFYIRSGPKDKSGKYVKKEDVKKIDMYLQKRYDKKALKIIKKELESLRLFIGNVSYGQEEIRNLFDSFPEKERIRLNVIDVPDDIS